MKKMTILVLLALATAAAPAFAQRRGKGPVANGEMLAQSCMACHGPFGASVASPMPIIGGQTEGFLNDAMKAFRDGTRPSTVMGRLAKAYTDPEIAALAKYFAAQPFVRPAQKLDLRLVEAGRVAYNRACKRCHVENGRESSEAQYPLLAGQWLDVMQIALADIRSGKRTVDEKFLAKLEELKPAEADAVLHFFAAQK